MHGQGTYMNKKTGIKFVGEMKNNEMWNGEVSKLDGSLRKTIVKGFAKHK